MPVNLAAQSEDVDKHSDHAFRFGVLPIGDRTSDTDIALARVAMEQDVEGGEQDHIQSAAPLFCQTFELRTQLRVQDKRVCRSGKALHTRPRIVCNQIQTLRDTGLFLLPVGELLLQYSALFQPCSLPHAVVDILNRQRRQLRTPALAQGVHDHAEFFDQHAHRPAITDDVVHREQQNVLLLGQPDYFAADQRTSR